MGYTSDGFRGFKVKEFTKIAVDYDKGRKGEDVGFWAGEAERFGGLESGSRVLDLGCGSGLYTVDIAKRTSASMCGLDPAVGMLAQARMKSTEVHWFNAVGENLPLRPGVFDCVFSSQVWHHITDKQGTAHECGRVLKAGGAVIIRTISHEQLREKVVFAYFPEILANQLRVYPSNDDFARFFGNAGFSSTQDHQYGLERFQAPSEFIEVAQKKLWSMFRPISPEGLERGVEELRRFERENPGKKIRNDETITLVVARKGPA
jgi:ubiquinone/menaquinone biosynthesis C-methylase UbiE